MELTPEIKNYIQEKMNSLDKFFGKIKIINASFEIELTSNHHLKGEIYRAETNIEVKGELLRIEKTEKNIFKAIDKAKDHLRLIIKKYKEKQKNY